MRRLDDDLVGALLAGLGEEPAQDLFRRHPFDPRSVDHSRTA
jgi:hypothetical protein